MNKEKEQRAIEYLRMFEPEEQPYYLCYSGGKDSDCIRILAQLAGVRHEIHHNLTTVDAPETVQYIKSIPNVMIDYPRISMWRLIVKNMMPPTRLARYCCSEMKERGGEGRLKITGVRWAESYSRKESSGIVRIIGKPKTLQRKAEENGLNYRVSRKGGLILNDDNDESRRFVEHCYRTTSTMVNPIVDWEDKDVWEFLHYYGCKGNPLYQCGEKRIGCIGCPMQGSAGMKRDFQRYPIYRANYIKAFDRMILERKKNGKETNLWETGEDVMSWWVGDNPAQITIDDYMKIMMNQR